MKTIYKLLLAHTLLGVVSCGPSKAKRAQTMNDSVTSIENIVQNKMDQAGMPIKEATTPDAIEKHMNFLASDALMGRDTGSEGIETAATYITNHFLEYGVKPYFETYRDNFKVGDLDAFNVVGVVEGSDPQLKNEYILIGAHYDHIGTAEKVDGDTIANGANDDASGTTAVLELAKYFAQNKTNKRSLIFATFTAEEKGLLGSKHLAKRMNAEGLKLYAMFNIEMIGVPMVDKDYLAYLTGFELSNLAEKFNEYAGTSVLGYLPKAKEYSLFKRSDNYAFYEEYKIPSQTVSTFDFTNFDFYHQVGDEVDQMDFKHMAAIINALVPGLEGMTNSATKEIMMN